VHAFIDTRTRFDIEYWEFGCLRGLAEKLATVSPVAGGRSSIGLTWGRMPDDTRLAEVKERMREWLRSVG